MGSTLIDESRVYKNRIENTVRGTNISYQRFYDTMLNFYRQNKKGDYEAAKQYGLVLSDWCSEYEFLYSDSKACLEYFNKMGYKIGIIANQLPGSKIRLQKFDIYKYISLVITSAEENIFKPNLKIFEIALKRAECIPKNAVMVGDRLDNDIAPANKIGMNTVCIKRGFAKYYVPQNKYEIADYTVNNLNELYCLFEK